MNDQLFSDLAAAHVTAGSAAGLGVRDALGVAPGQAPAADQFPVLGYFFTTETTAESAVLLLYMVTPGRLVRYEWSNAGSLTVTLPVERVSCVTERAVGPEFAVTVELDAQAAVTATETLTRTSPDHDSADDDTVSRGQQLSRTERATYALTATADDPTAIGRLAAFSRALRLSVGN